MEYCVPLKRLTVKDVHWILLKEKGRVWKRGKMIAWLLTSNAHEAKYGSVLVFAWDYTSMETCRIKGTQFWHRQVPCWWILSSFVCLKIDLFCLCFWKMFSWGKGSEVANVIGKLKRCRPAVFWLTLFLMRSCLPFFLPLYMMGLSWPFIRLPLYDCF